MTQAVAIFGGTFDPPHMGHAEMIQFALDDTAISEVWIFPVLRNRDGKTPVSFEHRLEMCARLAAPFGASVTARADERGVDTNGLTVRLLRHLREKHPDRIFRLLVGPDVTKRMELWPGYAEILRLAPLLTGRFVRGVSRERISSCEIRKRLKRHASVDLHVPKKVLNYIGIEGIYSTR